MSFENNSMDYNEDLILDAGEVIRDMRKYQKLSDINSIVTLSKKLLVILKGERVKDKESLFNNQEKTNDFIMSLEYLITGDQCSALFNENQLALDYFVENIVDENYFLCNEIMKEEHAL